MPMLLFTRSPLPSQALKPNCDVMVSKGETFRRLSALVNMASLLSWEPWRRLGACTKSNPPSHSALCFSGPVLPCVVRVKVRLRLEANGKRIRGLGLQVVRVRVGVGITVRIRVGS